MEIPADCLQMRACLRGRYLAQISFFLSRFRSGAIRSRSGRRLGFDRFQEGLGGRVRQTLMRLRTKANDLAVYVLEAVGVDPFAVHVVPAFRQRSRRNNFRRFAFRLRLLALDFVRLRARTQFGARGRFRVERCYRRESCEHNDR